MEILSITPDMQGTRVHGAGGMMLFNETWMNNKSTHPYIAVPSNGDNRKKK